MTTSKTTTKTASTKPTSKSGSKSNGTATPKAQQSKAKAAVDPEPEPEPESSSRVADDATLTEVADDMAHQMAVRAAGAHVREMTTSSPLYMQVLLDQAPGWYAEDDESVVDQRADKLTNELLLLGGGW